jgi:hypothetical protein
MSAASIPPCIIYSRKSGSSRSSRVNESDAAALFFAAGQLDSLEESTAVPESRTQKNAPATICRACAVALPRQQSAFA